MDYPNRGVENILAERKAREAATFAFLQVDEHHDAPLCTLRTGVPYLTILAGYPANVPGRNSHTKRGRTR